MKLSANGPRLRPAVAGLLSGLAGLAVAQAATAVTGQRLSPPNAVADAVIEATPGPVVQDLLHIFGRWDKPLLIGGVIAGLLLLSAWGGIASRRSPLRGQLVFLGLAAVAVIAMLTRPGSGPVDLLPVILGSATWFVVLPILTSAALAVPADGSIDVSGVSAARRAFLVRSGLVLVGTVVAGSVGELFGRKRRAVEAGRTALDLPVSRGSVPAGADLGLADLTPWRVPNAEFYRIDTAVVVPAIDAGEWTLRIHGMVENEITLSYSDLLERQLSEAWVTLCCVSNPVGGDLIGNAWWSGVRVADLLAEAKPLAGADAVLQTSHDGWNCGTPLSALTDDRDALLAVAMNGEPLPLEHGYPVRMVVPGLYGFVSATKWVVDLEVTRFEDFTAFWTDRGWSPRGPVRTQSRIDVPHANTRVEAGVVSVAGVAWAQHTGIESVEVRVDGGDWQPVELARVPSEDTWVQWSGAIQVDPGVHSVAVRATDRSGYTQTGVRRDVVPDGATGWHTLEFIAE